MLTANIPNRVWISSIKAFLVSRLRRMLCVEVDGPDGRSPSFGRERQTIGPNERGLEMPRIEMRIVPIGGVHAGPSNPREDFNESDLLDLAQSIRLVGIAQPITVRPDQNGDFEILAGERRWRAAGKAGLAEIPCVIRTGFTEAEDALITTAENMLRRDLNPIEQAHAYQKWSTAGWRSRTSRTRSGNRTAWYRTRCDRSSCRSRCKHF